MPRPPLPHRGLRIAERETGYFGPEIDGSLGVRERQRLQSARVRSYPNQPGYQDPLTFQLVLLALSDIEPAVQLRANEFALYLQIHFPQMIWDSVTVGRVLSDIQQKFAEYFRTSEVDERKAGLLQKTRDGKGTIYYLNDHPVVAKKAIEVIEDLTDLVNLEHANRVTGSSSRVVFDPLDECPSLRRVE